MNAAPDLATFESLFKPGRAIPVRVELEADTDTPVSALLKLSRGQSHAFLLESVEGGERSGRWSFLGAGPRSVYQWRLTDGGDPLAYLEAELGKHPGVKLPGLPRFSGGLVGFFSYDAVKLFEPRVPIANADELGFPDALFMDFDELVAFDNVRRTLHVVVEARCAKGDQPRALYLATLARIDALVQRLRAPLVDERPDRTGAPPVELRPRVSRPQFEKAVRAAREYIRAGDCQQIVLSQRFDAELDLEPLELYRALRRVNPSPYLFFLKAGDQALIGSSPETLVRCEDSEITLRPIAGTRRRGKDAREDARLETELRADPKENAEHVMLVDLGRNDVGRVAQVGSVHVDVFKTIERYSHVMHMVSQVKGKLDRKHGPLDVLRATFPAGTVSGAPKVRAMEIIDELEPARRGPYAGCVGYLDRLGNMEMCIAIRTLLQSGRRVSVQAGAGLVYDSKPAAEYAETVNKAKALFVAVAEASRGSAGRTLNPPPSGALRRRVAAHPRRRRRR